MCYDQGTGGVDCREQAHALMIPNALALSRNQMPSGSSVVGADPHHGSLDPAIHPHNPAAVTQGISWAYDIVQQSLVNHSASLQRQHTACTMNMMFPMLAGHVCWVT